MRLRLALLAAVSALATPALAQPGSTAPTYGPPPEQAPVYAPPAAQPAPVPPPSEAPPTYAPPAPAPQPQPQPQPQPYPPQHGYAPHPHAPAPTPATAGQPYAGQPYAGQPYPQPYAGQPYPQPYAGQPYPQPYAGQPYTGQPDAGPQPGPRIDASTRPAKVESTASWLAVGVTALGLGAVYLAVDDNNEALGWAGLATAVIGPSAGHIYAGESKHALKMSALRAAGLATFVYGAVEGSTSYDCLDAYDCGGSENDGSTAMLIGGAIVVGATLYDFYDASRSVRRFNAKREPSMVVAPTMMSARGGSSPGVALSGRF